MSVTTLFRRVFSMVLDGDPFLEFRGLHRRVSLKGEPRKYRGRVLLKEGLPEGRFWDLQKMITYPTQKYRGRVLLKEGLPRVDSGIPRK